MATISGISLIKKLSLIFNRKAYLVYTNNPIPSLLVPVPTVDKTLKSAIYKTFADLTNDDVIRFHNKLLAEKDLNEIQRANKASLNVDVVDLPQEYLFQSVEGVEIKPNSVFLTVNREDKSLSFMEYADIQGHLLKAETKPGQALRDGEKPQKQKSQKDIEKDTKNIKGPARSQHPTGQPLQKEHPGQKNPKAQKIQPQPRPASQKQQFKDQVPFQKKQMSTWNQQSPQLSTPPQKQPKQDISDLRTNKFIPLAYLSDSITTKPIEIIHIQTSRQYLLLQLLKLFGFLNVLCVYGLVRNWSRRENHHEGKGK